MPLWPALDYTNRTQELIDPQTGVMLKQVTGPSDSAGVLPNPWAGNTFLYPASGNAWSSPNLPARITNNNTHFLGVHLNALNTYLFNNGNDFTADYFASINSLQTTITASTSAGSCNTTATDDCKITFCVSIDGVTCHPYSKQIDQALTTNPTLYTIGDQTLVNMGGWIKPGYRWLNSFEVAYRFRGSLSCNGTATVTNTSTSEVFNPYWNAGSLININNIGVSTVASVQNEGQITLTAPCPKGTYTWTALNASILVRAKTANANTITLAQGASTGVGIADSPSAPAGAAADICSFTSVSDNQGNPGWNCIATGESSWLFWVNAKTGEGRMLLPLNFYSPYISCFGQMMFFSATNADTMYCSTYSNTPVQIYSVTYKGDHTDQSGKFAEGLPGAGLLCNDPVNPTNKPCWAMLNLTTGTALGTLVTSFNPAFDESKWTLVGGEIGTNQHHGEMYFRAWRSASNYAIAWQIVFDPTISTNSQPGNAGCVSAALHDPSKLGCVVAAVPSYAAPQHRGGDTKDTYSNVDNGFIEMNPFFTNSGGGADGQGFQQVTTSAGFVFSNSAGAPGGLAPCPSNPYAVTGTVCTTVNVSGEPFINPHGPTETGNPGEYITAQPGDILCVNCTEVSAGENSNELIRILVKNSSTNWIVQRAFQYGVSCSTQVCGGSPSPLTSKPNPTLTYVVYSPGWREWDFVNDPSMQNLYINMHGLGSHYFVRRGIYVESTSQAPAANSLPDGAYQITYLPRAALPSGVTATPVTGFTPSNPAYNGIYGVAVINSTQSHPSGSGLSADENDRGFFFDARPYNGRYSSPPTCLPSPVTGSLYVYAGCLTLNRKLLPTHATVGIHILADISGPNSTIGGDPTYNWTYCVALRSGECQSGSSAGYVYFNTPWLQYNYCVTPGQATSGADLTTVCIHDASVADDSIMQLGANVSADLLGLHQRMISRAFAAPSVNSPFWNIAVMPDSKFAITRSKFIRGHRSDFLSMQLPPAQVDRIARNAYLNQTIAVPAGGGAFAVVRFGYAKYGSNGTSFQCSSRAEDCLAGAGGAPYAYAFEKLTPTPCSGGCTITVPLISNEVAFVRVDYTDASGNTLSTGPVNLANPEWGARQ